MVPDGVVVDNVTLCGEENVPPFGEIDGATVAAAVTVSYVQLSNF